MPAAVRQGGKEWSGRVARVLAGSKEGSRRRAKPVWDHKTGVLLQVRGEVQGRYNLGQVSEAKSRYRDICVPWVREGNGFQHLLRAGENVYVG